MKIPEKLIGFVTYNEQKYPFSVEDDELFLFPKDEQIRNERAYEFFDNINTVKKNEWIGQLNLTGELSNGYNITFRVEDFASNNNGFLSFPILNYVVYSNELKLDNINGLILSCDEVNYFYSPNKTFETNVNFYNTTNELEKMEVKANNIDENIGTYMVDNIGVNISLQAIPTIYFNSDTPFKSKSEMVIGFDRPCNLDFVLDYRRDLRYFMIYICFRSNVFFTDTDIYILNEAGKRKRCGKIVDVREKNIIKEENKKKEKKIIKYDLLGNRCIDLLSIIHKDEIYFNHICNSIDETHSYDVARYVKIFAAFEREFRNIYGEDYKRNEKYVEVKEEVVKMLQQKVENNSGNVKNYFKEIKRMVEKLDNSLEIKIKHALNDCDAIISAVINSRYVSKDDRNYDIIANRLGNLRNNITHANLDFEVEPINLEDLYIIQILLYIMRLKSLNIDTQNIKLAIRDLFELRIGW